MTISAERTEHLLSDLAANLNRCMTAADVDVPGLADRTEIPAERLEVILAGTSEANMTEIMLCCEALDVPPSEILPTTRDV